MESSSTDPSGDIIHKTESELYSIILVFSKDSSNISVKALRKSPLLDCCAQGQLRDSAVEGCSPSFGILGQSCPWLLWSKASEKPDSLLLRATHISHLRAATLFGSHLSYTFHCTAAIPVPDHEPWWSKFEPWSVHCIPGLTCSSLLQTCFVITAQCLRLHTTARPRLPHSGAAGLGSYCPGSCLAACVVVLCSWLPLTCGTVNFHCFLTISPGIHILQDCHNCQVDFEVLTAASSACTL